MTVKEIADQLVAYCRKGDFESAQKNLYGKDVVSIEPEASPDFEKETKGFDAVLAKIEKFDSMVDEYHHIEVSEPIVAGQSFAVTMRMDLTMKGKGRMDMTELCVYKVKDDKIVSEAFFM